MENDAQSAQIALKIETTNKMKSGADWFFWIAGLSLVNSIILLTGGSWSFIVGLGATQIIDSIAGGVSDTGKVIAFVLDIVVAGVFVLFGVFARKKKNRASQSLLTVH